MYLRFANGKPNSINITFGHLEGLFRKTVTLSRKDLNKEYIPINVDINAKITCPFISYKITDDSASSNAILFLELTVGKREVCAYENLNYGETYPTATKVSMKNFKPRI